MQIAQQKCSKLITQRKWHKTIGPKQTSQKIPRSKFNKANSKRQIPQKTNNLVVRGAIIQDLQHFTNFYTA